MDINPIREGEAVTSVRGVITGINVRDRRSYSPRGGANITVRCGSSEDNYEDYSFDVPRPQAERVHIGQKVAVQIIVTASEEPAT